MQFSIIIPTCNRNDLLAKCLDCLAPDVQTIDSHLYEVIVTDDGTGDLAKEMIEKNYPWVQWVQGPKRGPAANRNNGALIAKGECLIFIDDDCLPDSKLIVEYNKAVSSKNEINVFEGSVLANRSKIRFDEESPINTSGGNLWSCNFLIKKKFFDDIKGFDENFPYPAMEDVDLSYRIKKADEDISFISNALVIHPWRKQNNLIEITLKRYKSILFFTNKFPEKKSTFDGYYFFKTFLHSFFKDTIRNAFKYRFRGFYQKLKYDFILIYIAIKHTFFKY